MTMFISYLKSKYNNVLCLYIEYDNNIKSFITVVINQEQLLLYIAILYLSLYETIIEMVPMADFFYTNGSFGDKLSTKYSLWHEQHGK